MPLYEYQCANEDCAKPRFEVIQKFSDDPLAECPTCGADVRKLLSAPAVHFKGSGWYVTDYGKGGEKPKDGKDGGADTAKSDGDKSEKKADSKSSDGKSSDSSKKSESKPAATTASTKD